MISAINIYAYARSSSNLTGSKSSSEDNTITSTLGDQPTQSLSLSQTTQTKCPEGQAREPDSGKCMPVTPNNPCPVDQTMDSASGKCMPVTPNNPCPVDQTMDSASGKCMPVTPSNVNQPQSQKPPLQPGIQFPSFDKINTSRSNSWNLKK